MSRSIETILLLDADPDLAEGLSPGDSKAARARSHAAVVDVVGPHWDPTPFRKLARPDWLGLFVVEGAVIRSVSVGSRTACELFGPGDLTRPWGGDHDYDPLPIDVSWRVPRGVRQCLWIPR